MERAGRGLRYPPGWDGMGATSMAQPVTIAVLGAGARGHTFASFAEQFGDRARVVAVAAPRADRRDELAGRLGVPAGRRFRDWRGVGAQPRLGDAGVVTTPAPQDSGAGG